MINEPKKRGRPASYESYVRQYKEKEKALAKKGLEMRENMYTEEEWRVNHRATVNSRKREIAEGKRKTISDINRRLVEKQAYTYSSKQGMRARTAYRKQHPDVELPSLMEFRSSDLSEAINARRDELFDAGLSAREVRRQIAYEFFDSPE